MDLGMGERGAGGSGGAVLGVFSSRGEPAGSALSLGDVDRGRGGVRRLVAP